MGWRLLRIQLLGLGLVVSMTTLGAQPQDTATHLWIQSSSHASLEGPLPYYHYFNQGGKWTDEKVQMLQRVGADHRWMISRRVSLEMGTEAYLRGDAPYTYIQEAYVLSSYGDFQLLLGQLSEDKLYRPYPKPAIGDMGLSDNAAPIPRVGLVLRDYLSVPGLKGWVAFHGAFYHGWLARERHVARPYWHQKQLHLRIGSPSKYASFTIGLRHYVTWNGRDEKGDLLYANGLENLWRVMLARPIDEEDGLNAGGNHVGVWDYALQVYTAQGNAALYVQKVFDDDFQQLLLRRHTRAAFHNGIWGLSFQIDPLPWLKSVQYERLHTTRQSGPGLVDPTPEHPTLDDNFGYVFGGRDNLYNNYFYQSGYTFRGWILGQGLMMTRERAKSLGLPLRDYPSHRVWNHRIKGHHISTRVRITSSWLVGLDLTYTENYGTYFGYYGGLSKWEGKHRDPNYFYYFSPPKQQSYTQLLVSHQRKDRWNFELSLAIDRGEMYNSWGLQGGVRYYILY